MNQKSNLNLFTPANWKHYRLLDSGNGEKLEQFGQTITCRPEPQAMWDKILSEKEWDQQAHVKFIQQGSHSGSWKKTKPVGDHWVLPYETNDMSLKFNLSLTGFKHVGIFPEQAVNWDFIFNATQKLKQKGEVKVLNLFAYTGGASLAAKAAGADVTHVDSIKQVISWSKQNMESSRLTDIRWVVEDAFKFVQREVKRGKKYNGIILDPPAYGIGANGERWKLEDQINEMLKELKLLLHPDHFFILNMYSLGMSALITENLVGQIFAPQHGMETGEIYLPSQTGQRLPLGIVCRFTNV